jgi:hypothetical protein
MYLVSISAERSAGAGLPLAEKIVIGSSAAVHRSVGMLFAQRRKFGIPL